MIPTTDPTIFWIIAFFLVGLGLAGTLLPVIPGTSLVFLGLVVAASIDGFQKVGWITLVILGLLTAASYGIDLVATAQGTKRVGASKKAVVGAVLGSIVGLFFGIPGLLIGPFAGAVAGEWLVHRDLKKAGKAGVGTWIGLVISGVAKLVLAFIMIGLFVTAYLL